MNILNNINEITGYMENCKHFNIIKIYNNFSKIDIDIDENNSSVIKMKYGLIYHSMSYCTEIQINFKDTLLYFVKYDKIKSNTFDTSIINCLNLDFSFKNILRGHSQDKKISGSETRNNTYLYCYDLITVDILSCIYNIDKKTQNIQIIFPTIASSVVTEMIYIFSYLCNELYLEKNGDWLKDSFIMCGIGIDKEKLKQLKSELENSIKFTEKNRTKKLVKLLDNVTNDEFKFNISKYNLLIQNICSTFWNIIFSNVKNNEIERIDNIWKMYDTLLKI